MQYLGKRLSFSFSQLWTALPCLQSVGDSKLHISSATDGCCNANHHLFIQGSCCSMGSWAVYQHQKRGLVPLLSCLACPPLSQLQSGLSQERGQRGISHICITKWLTCSKNPQQNIRNLLCGQDQKLVLCALRGLGLSPARNLFA